MSFTAYIASCYKHVIRNEGEFIILSKLTICFQVSPGIGSQFFFNHLYFPDQFFFWQKLYCLIFYIYLLFCSSCFKPTYLSQPSLICDFCSSYQRFAYSFLQILPHGRHPCCSAIHFPLSGRVRDFHPLERAHGAQTKSPVCTYLCKPGLYLTYLVTIKLYQFRNFISCFLHRFFKFSKADICLFGCYIYF